MLGHSCNDTPITPFVWWIHLLLCAEMQTMREGNSRDFPYVSNFSEGKYTYLHFMPFLHIDTGSLNPFSSINLPILHQYHRCWCPGDAGSQGISNHDIYCVEPYEFGPRMLWVETGVRLDVTIYIVKITPLLKQLRSKPTPFEHIFLFSKHCNAYINVLNIFDTVMKTMWISTLIIYAFVFLFIW